MNWVAVILIALCVVILLLPPRYDPAIRWKRKLTEPECYGDYPFLHGQEAAERDCAHCSHAYGCHEDSPDPRINR